MEQAMPPDRSGSAVTDVNALHRRGLGYEAMLDLFRIDRPRHFNLAVDTVGRHARGAAAAATALVCAGADGAVRMFSYRDLDVLSDRFAVFLAGLGVGRGDVVVCYAAQGLAAAVAPLAAYKLGAINAPLSLLYGPRTMEHALRDSGARVVVSERTAWDRLIRAGIDLSAVAEVVIEDGAGQGEHDFAAALRPPATGFRPTPTCAEDPALLLYTSGSTGLPKGILHAHRFLLGYFSSVSLFYQLDMDEPGMVLWTPSDWSWIAGIVNVMLTGWHFGHTVVAGQARFEPEWAFSFMERHGVTHTFLTPTALKRMAQLPEPRRVWPRLALRAIGTGGEPLPSAVLAWSREVLGVAVNEFYGLTEVNHLIGNCQRLYPVRPGSMGRAYPGHVVAVIDEAGAVLPDGTPGEIAARDDDPTLFLGYWNQPERSAAMRLGRWIRTGDFGVRDEDGYFWYHGRQDDLIKSAGYRIGPAEVEDTLLRHPAVAEAAVVGRPDPARGQVVVAYVRLAEGHVGDAALLGALQDFVKAELAIYKFPRSIRFVDRFPLTSTGKISRKELRSREIEMLGQEGR